MNDLIIFCAQYLFVFVILSTAAAWLKASRKIKPQFVITIVLSGIIALILSRIAGKLYFDPRPFVTEHVKPLVSHAADNGFPSDHALLTMALTAITYFYNKRAAAVMLILTVLVGLARVLAKVHSPLDIAGAWLIAIVSSIAGYYLTLWLFRCYERRTRRQPADKV